MTRKHGEDAFFREELAEVREINAHLPFADPIMPGFEWPHRGGLKYYTRDIDSYRKHDSRRRALRRMIALSQKHDLYADEF